MIDLRNSFILFITYAFLGWIVEIIDIFIFSKKVVNRGFLIGPYCPIYGLGAYFMTILFSDKEDLFSIFSKSLIICSLLEYFTSYIMEKIFKKRWWDYSNEKLNLNGRICLKNMVLFGIAGCLVIKYSNPNLISFYNSFNNNTLNIFAITLVLIFIVDLIISLKIILSVKNIKFKNKDSTIEIKAFIKRKIRQNYFIRRLLRAFPDIQESQLKRKHKLRKKS